MDDRYLDNYVIYKRYNNVDLFVKWFIVIVEMKTLLLMAILLIVPAFAFAQERSDELTSERQTVVHIWFYDNMHNLDSIVIMKWFLYKEDSNDTPTKFIVEYSDANTKLNKVAFLFNGNKLIAAIDLKTATFDERCKFATIACSKTM